MQRKLRAIQTRTGPRQAVERNFFLGQTEDPQFIESIKKHWPWIAVGAALLLLALTGKKQ